MDRRRISRLVSILLWLTGFAVASVSGSSAAWCDAIKNEQLQFGYHIQTPEHFSIAAAQSVDFVLYKMSNSKGRLFLTIYIGNFPDTRFETPRNSTRTSKAVCGFPAEFVRWSGKGGRLNGSTLIHLPQSSTEPVLAHMLFMNLSKAESTVVERVITSFCRDRHVDAK